MPKPADAVATRVPTFQLTGRCSRRTLRQMSELLPNLESLIDELSGSSAGTHDARILAMAASAADSAESLDEALSAVAKEWQRL